MCGIIGYIGKNDFISNAKQGLLNLEYRGYDSAGLSFFDKENIMTLKNVGDVTSLFDIVPNNIDTHCGIGHTRWATHGIPSVENCHPHFSQNKKIYVVHNGIIENYQQIKLEFLSNVNFYSGTDTEVIPNLINKFLSDENNMLKAINKTIGVLKGAFALAILNKDEPEKIYFARRNSPLLIGLGKTENYISSDLIGFGDKIKKYIVLDDNCYGFITNSKVKIFNSGKEIKPEIKKIKDKVFTMSKGSHPYYMIKEINDIPLAITETCKIYSKQINPLTKIPKEDLKNLDEVILIACGTSYHSCLVGEKYLKLLANIKSKSIVASEFIYQKEVISKNTLCVFISQSGETADTLSAIKKAKQLGAKTLGITNVITSTIARECDYILPIKAGSEVAVASTKAYNAQLVMLLILAGYLGNNLKLNKTLQDKLKLATKCLDITKLENNIEPLEKKLNRAKNVYFVGRDIDYVTCLEASLKLKEISYIPCEAYSAGELKHGTLALISKNTPVIAIITQKSLIDKTMMIVNQVKARGGKIYIFTNKDLSKYDLKGCKVINLPSPHCELISPITSIVPFQILAYKISTSLGYNPDRPRNLAKSVTVE